MSVFNINIAVLGTVSSGKSTLLNSLFLEELTSMKINRNTMVPQIYRELINNKAKKVKEAKEINHEVSMLNDDLKLKMEDENYDFTSDMKPMEFYIHKLKDFTICEKNIYLSFYDLPGFNDSKNHEMYYDYAKKHFKEFDIILYLIDLHTGLNTKDEMDVLNFVFKNSDKYNKHIIPIINKSDDMTMQDNELICQQKYQNNYNDIIKLLVEYQNKYPNAKVNKSILYSAQESYMYRMLLKNPEWDLNEEMKNTIGLNEMGKKYFTLSNDERNTKLKEITRNEKFIQDMIKMCGYSYLYETLSNVMTSNNQLEICKNKLLDEYNKLTTNVIIDKTNAIEIYNKFQKVYEDSIKLQNIFKVNENIIDSDKFIKYVFDTMITNNNNKILDEIIGLKECVQTLKNHEFGNKLKKKIIKCEEEIKNDILTYYAQYYDKKFTIGDLIYILEKIKFYGIESHDALDEYSTKYIDEMIEKNINFYHDFNPNDFKSIVNFDTKYKNEITELNKYVSKQIIKKICKYIIKNKISSLIAFVNGDNNKNDCICGLYNLMLFYNYYSNKDIEYSEIYTILLSNYISILSTNNTNGIKYDKDDSLMIIDEKFVNI